MFFLCIFLAAYFERPTRARANVPPDLPPVPQPDGEDGFVDLFAQLKVSPPGTQTPHGVTSMWHVPMYPPPPLPPPKLPRLTDEEAKFGIRAYLWSLAVLRHNRHHRGDPRRYAIANTFMRGHYTH
ncbi:hypothetical protein BJV82DRAFT_666689 [Fennellomyces sp. T-0311]|nr:hypothetical protein BJV82DRAFT_666689 [Fennellomyces sp. T-0311]